MSDLKQHSKILIVDDEWESSIVRAVRRRLEEEGWRTVIVDPEMPHPPGEDFETATLYAIEEEQPDGVLLDVRFGEHKDDRFKGLGILRKLVDLTISMVIEILKPAVPVIIFLAPPVAKEMPNMENILVIILAAKPGI